jgi:dTDP-4-dehydrorhamnose reductase
MQRILLTGATGQIGRALHQQMVGIWSDAVWYCPTRIQLDLSCRLQIQTVLDQFAPTLIINAAAYTAVDQAETERASVLAINTIAPTVMAQWAAQHHAMLVQYSTDYVFDGQLPYDQAYLETHLTQPINYYGYCKQQAEQAILASGCLALILRTSWVYADMGHNFIQTILRLARERNTLSIVDDQIGTPNDAQRIAYWTMCLLQQDSIPTGIYHVSAIGQTSWYGLAHYVLDIAQQYERWSCVLTPIPSIAYPTPARRPHNSRLDTHKLQTQLAVDLPHWSVDVAQMLTRYYAARLTIES